MGYTCALPRVSRMGDLLGAPFLGLPGGVVLRVFLVIPGSKTSKNPVFGRPGGYPLQKVPLQDKEFLDQKGVSDESLHLERSFPVPKVPLTRAFFALKINLWFGSPFSRVLGGCQNWPKRGFSVILTLLQWPGGLPPRGAQNLPPRPDFPRAHFLPFSCARAKRQKKSLIPWQVCGGLVGGDGGTKALRRLGVGLVGILLGLGGW